MTEENDNQNGEAPPDLTPEQLLEMLERDIGTQLVGLAASFAPDFPQEHLGEVVRGLAREQMVVIQEIVPSLVDEKILKTRGRFHVVIQQREPAVAGSERAEPFIMQVKKRLEKCDTPFDALGQALVLSFLLMPAVRALLRMYGWDYTFREPKHDDGTDRPGGLTLIKG